MDTTQTETQVPPALETPAATPLKLTERAIAQVREIIKAQGFEGYYLSVRVVPSGCSGFGYDLNLVKEAKPNEVTWAQEDVQVVTDKLSLQYLNGTEVDYVQGLQGAGFKFSNPNAKSSCGCGNSFST